MPWKLSGATAPSRPEPNIEGRRCPITRVALYARYSSDQQNPSSVADQLLVCREWAEREGWQIVGSYDDPAISGASVVLRPGVQALLKDAEAGRFDVVLAEALDRVSRDQADTATL